MLTWQSRQATRQQIGCLNSIVKVQIVAVIFLSSYLLSKVEFERRRKKWLI